MYDVDSPSRPEAPARVFSFCWALATFLHLTLADTGLSSPSAVVLLLCASVLLMTSGAALAWLGLALSGLADFWLRLPMVTGSELLTATLYVVVIVGFCGVSARKRSWRVTRTELYDEVRPVLGSVVILMLAAAVFFKLNATFFDMSVSPAPGFYDDLNAIFGVPRIEWLRDLTPQITIAIESAIAVALLFRRTRGTGIALLWALWLLIGIIGIVTFSAKLYALSLLFVDPRLLARLCSGLERRLGANADRKRTVLQALVLVVMTLVALVRLDHFFVVVLLFVPLALAFLCTLVSTRVRAGLPLGSPSFPRPAPYLMVVLLLASLNEAGSFLRLKDWPSYRIYCGLSTHSCETNHLLLGVRQRPFEDPIVTTEETWSLLWSQLELGQRGWEAPVYWSGQEVWKGRRVWDPSSFAEALAMLARKNDVDPRELQLTYLRRGDVVRGSLDDLLRREGHASFRRFFALYPEPESACTEP